MRASRTAVSALTPSRMESSTFAGSCLSFLSHRHSSSPPSPRRLQPIPPTSMKGSDPAHGVLHRPSVSDPRGRSVGSGPRQGHPRSSARHLRRLRSLRLRLVTSSPRAIERRPRAPRISSLPGVFDQMSQIRSRPHQQDGGTKVHTAAATATPAPHRPLASYQRHQRDMREVGSSHRNVRSSHRLTPR